MRIIILTQDENLYLPEAFAHVCEKLGEEVCCIVLSPPMSTHGGAIKGFLRHLRLFGLVNTCRLAYRVMRNKGLSRLRRPGWGGKFYSLEAVGAFYDIPVVHISKIAGDDFQALLEKYKPELLISISCPQIIGKKIRERMPLGCINVHGAPLPRYRGLMPAFWVLRNGETATAVSVHDLEAKLDDGDILVQREVLIEEGDTWDSLVRKTKSTGARALVEAIEQIRNGSVERKPNLEDEATYFSFPTAEDRKAFFSKGRRFF